MLESELQRSGKSLKDYRGSTLKRVLDSIGVTSLNKLLTELGSGKRTGNIVAERFYSGLKIRKDSDSKKIKPVFIHDNHIEGVSVIFAKCCNPVYRDPVIAHSDTDRGIVIHHKRCKQVAPFISKDPRYIPGKWAHFPGIYLGSLEIKGATCLHRLWWITIPLSVSECAITGSLYTGLQHFAKITETPSI